MKLGLCLQSLIDSQVPKLFSVGSLLIEFCVSSIFVLIVNNHKENVSTSLDKYVSVVCL